MISLKDPLDLAKHITRHMTLPPQAQPVALRVATHLLHLRGAVPVGDCLILGGSLSRGEPAIVPAADGNWSLASDVDLLMVHSTLLPSLATNDFDAHAQTLLPTATTMSVSIPEYQKLGTCLGQEFKRGVVLAGEDMAVDPVTLDARDGYELLLYGVQSWLWDGIVTAWRLGADTRLDMRINRICLKILLGCVVLGGGDRCGQIDAAPVALRDRLRAELRWRTDPCSSPLPRCRFWPLVADALTEFDERIGIHPDAVTNTPYQYKPGAAAAGEQQRIAHAFARIVPQLLQKGPNSAENVERAQRTAWIDLVDRGAVRPAPSAESHFATHVHAVRANMLRLKTASDITTQWPWTHITRKKHLKGTTSSQRLE